MSTSVCGNYAFSTVYEDFTNVESGPRNFRVVKIRFDRFGNEIGRSNEIIAVAPGQNVTIYQNLNNTESVIFRLFRRDYATDGTYDEVKVWERSHTAPLCPLGPR